MAAYTTLGSVGELDTLLSKNTFVLLDFWATWCPPCKAIAPLFEQLASKNTIPDGLAFAKVDVDAQAQISLRYGITAMPTFILLRNGKEVKNVRGANAAAIRELVKHAKTELAEKKREYGEEVNQEEVENDGVDESVLPSQGVDIRSSLPLLVLIFALLYFIMR